MTTETDPDFPDVSVGARTALALTIAAAVLYAVIFLGSGVPARASAMSLLASLVLSAALLLLTYIDLRTGLLLDVLTLPLIVAGIAWAAFESGTWLQSLIGAGLGYGLIAALALYWRRTRGHEGIGLGDAKLLAAGGAWVGVLALPMVLLISSTLGLAIMILVSLRSQAGRDRLAMPFGPCLGLGIWIVWCLINAGLL